jgi:CRP/FNR family cyclic AMP-dependent transcriptional regulator
MTRSAMWSVLCRDRVSVSGTAALSSKVQKLLADCSRECRYPPGEALAFQGDRLRQVFIVQSGYVKLVHRRTSGRDVVVSVRGPGGIIGTPEVLANRPLAATVVATTDVIASAVTSRLLRDRAEQNHQLSYALLLLESLSACEQPRVLLPLHCSTARERVQQFFVALAEGHTARDATSKFVTLRLPVSQQELACLLDISPETLSRTLATLETEGVVKRCEHGIQISVDGAAASYARPQREHVGGRPEHPSHGRLVTSHDATRRPIQGVASGDVVNPGKSHLTKSQKPAEVPGTAHHPVVQQVMSLLRNRFSERWTVSAIALAVGLDRCYLSRLFKADTGRTVHEFLLLERLCHAEVLILKGEKIEVAALMAGFRSRRNFQKCFTHTRGMTPSEFRRTSRFAPPA